MPDLSAVIDDGYTRRSLFKGREGMYPDVVVEWRPTTVRRRAIYAMELDGKTPLQQEEIGATALAKQIVSWDITHNGQPFEVTRDNILKLHTELFNRLYACIINMKLAPDQELAFDAVGPSLDAAVAGMSLEELLEKNS